MRTMARYTDRGSETAHSWLNQHVKTSEGERGKVTWVQHTRDCVILHVQSKAGYAFLSDSNHAEIVHEHEEEID